MRDKDSPAPLPRLNERVNKLDAARAALFPMWKKLLEESEGNISLAGRLAFADEVARALTSEEVPKIEKRMRNRALWTVKRLGLVEYARELRRGVGRDRGRPRSST